MEAVNSSLVFTVSQVQILEIRIKGQLIFWFLRTVDIGKSEKQGELGWVIYEKGIYE